VGLFAASLAIGAASSTVKTLTARSGSVKATITYTPAQFLEAKNVRVKITRGGTTAFNKPLSSLSRPTALRARDLNRDGEPEILADFYTGGAHCCNYTLLYRYNGKTYSSIRHIWGDLSYRLKDFNGDGITDFLSGDDRFAYKFTSYAGSAFPIRMWTYHRGTLIDVTRTYPALVAADATTQWKSYLDAEKAPDADPRGILAAWTADQYLLGKKVEALGKLNTLAQQGKLTGDTIWPTGENYVNALKKFLVKLGYAGVG
jgi:hypothetical protein